MNLFSRSESSKFSHYDYTEIENYTPHDCLSTKSSAEDAHKRTKLANILKEEFSYCICLRGEEKFKSKPLNNDELPDKNNSTLNIDQNPMFTWTPNPSRKDYNIDEAINKKSNANDEPSKALHPPGKAPLQKTGSTNG